MLRAVEEFLCHLRHLAGHVTFKTGLFCEFFFCCGDCAFEIKVYFNQTKFHPAPDCLMGLGNEASVMHPLVCLCKMIKLLQGCYDDVVWHLHPPFLQQVHAWSFQYLCHTILPFTR